IDLFGLAVKLVENRLKGPVGSADGGTLGSLRSLEAWLATELVCIGGEQIIGRCTAAGSFHRSINVCLRCIGKQCSLLVLRCALRPAVGVLNQVAALGAGRTPAKIRVWRGRWHRGRGGRRSRRRCGTGCRHGRRRGLDHGRWRGLVISSVQSEYRSKNTYGDNSEDQADNANDHNNIGALLFRGSHSRARAKMAGGKASLRGRKIGIGIIAAYKRLHLRAKLARVIISTRHRAAAKSLLRIGGRRIIRGGTRDNRNRLCRILV